MSSPSSITYRPSDGGIDFYNFDWNYARSIGWHKFENATRMDFDRLELWKEERGMKFRCHYFDGEIFIKFPTNVHESVVQSFYAVRDYNSLVSGGATKNSPIKHSGSGNEYLMGDFVQQPDYSCTVFGRKSKNLVVEVGFSQTNTDLVRHLKNYIKFTDDVMIAIGISIYNLNAAGNAAMVFMAFERLAENVEIATKLISFGTAPLQSQARQNLETLCGRAVEGVGVGDIPCDREHVDNYLVPIPYNYLLNVDNMGLILFQPLVLPPGMVSPPDFVINLVEMQEDIMNGLRTGP